MRSHHAITTGVALVLLYTLTMSAGDGIVKYVAATYEAPQLFAISALVVVLLSCGFARVRGECRAAFRTGAPVTMFWRSVFTVAATFAFFMAFRLLPLADIFLFVGLMPVIAAMMSGPILGEPVRVHCWAALGLGLIGVYCLLPGGMATFGPGHVWAALATISGTTSMVLARYISRWGTSALAQVMYPNLAVALAMAVALPLTWKAMPWVDLALVLAYAVTLFAARWLLVEAFVRLKAHVATPLLNVQFVWMAVIGYAMFGEIPAQGTMIGAFLVVLSGMWLVIGEYWSRRAASFAAS